MAVGGMVAGEVGAVVVGVGDQDGVRSDRSRPRPGGRSTVLRRLLCRSLPIYGYRPYAYGYGYPYGYRRAYYGYRGYYPYRRAY